MWSAGREKVTRNAAWAEAVILSALARRDCVRWAIGCMSVGGFCSAATLGGATATLGSVATTLGAVGWVTLTLGSVAWRAIWVVGGRACVESGVGMLRFQLKIARRLSTARSCALQLSGVLSALTAMVSARRQWMILSVVVSVGTDSVGC